MLLLEHGLLRASSLRHTKKPIPLVGTPTIEERLSPSTREDAQYYRHQWLRKGMLTYRRMAKSFSR